MGYCKPFLAFLSSVTFLSCHYNSKHEKRKDEKKVTAGYNLNYRFHQITTRLFLERVTIPVEIFALCTSPQKGPNDLPVRFSGHMEPGCIDYEMLNVPARCQSHCILNKADLWLDAASKFTTLSFSSFTGNVNLSGECCLQTNDQQWIIQAEEIVVKVSCRSKLNIKAYDNESTIVITLCSGIIDVSRQGQHCRLLKAGTQLTFYRWLKQPVKSEAIVDDVIAWTKGRLSGEYPDRMALCRMLERLYCTHIVCRTSAAEHYNPYSIPFRYMSLSEILEDFKNGLTLYPTFSNDTIYLNEKPVASNK